MSEKINVSQIVKLHFSTFQNEAGKISWTDWATLVFLPAIIAMILSAYKVAVSNSVYANIIMAGALFTGLLLNLLVLVYDQKIKILDKNIKGDNAEYVSYAIRKKVINETHNNISYSVIVSLLIVVFSTIGSFDFCGLIEKQLFNYEFTFNFRVWLINFPLYFLCIHLVVLILMILKRVHLLISSH